MPSESDGGRPRSASRGIGNNGLPPAGRVRVEDIQRARLLASMVEVSSEHGLADATVAHVVAHAGVSRRTFYEIFEDREACFLAALEEAIARASRYVLDAYDPSAKWAERVRSALTALLTFLDGEPGAAQLMIVRSLAAGANALARRRRVLAQMIAAVDEGRQENARSELPPLTADGVVGGALSIVYARLIASHPGQLVELTGPLMSMIVLPYLGPAAARKELERPVPKPRSHIEHANGDPLRGLGMRLTYRTVRVLMSVAATPGASNREVGEAAGIADQGQISKLLGRLERLGLVHNTGLTPGKGAPNVWTLTERGREVEHAMNAPHEGEHSIERKQADGGPRSVEASGRSRR